MYCPSRKPRSRLPLKHTPARPRRPTVFPDPRESDPPVRGRLPAATRDLFLAQRFARHASPLTTVIYTHVSDEEMFERLRGMEC